MKYLAIDPGTQNLGWALMEDSLVLDCGVEKIWETQKPIRESLTEATVDWARANLHLLEEVDKVLIELQYHQKGSMATFGPMIVMQTLSSVVRWQFPGKVSLIHPQAAKRRFQITGDYNERKRQVVQRFGPQIPSNTPLSRQHDVADCILMVEYFRGSSASTIIPSPLEVVELKRNHDSIMKAFNEPPRKRRKRKVPSRLLD